MVFLGLISFVAGIIALFNGAIGPGIAMLVIAWLLIGIGADR